MNLKNQYSILFLFLSIFLHAQKNNNFPKKTTTLHQKVELFTQLMLDNNLNDGQIISVVIYPPAGFGNTIVGRYAENMDETTNMLVAYSYKYALMKNIEDQKMAHQLFDALLKMETVTGIPGLMSRGYYKSDKPLWHESLWYNEWHWSTSMEGYRWMGDLSADKFTSLCYAAGIFWDLCANKEYKQKVSGLMDRFMNRIIEDNYKLTDLDGKMTLWGNYCPNLPHQPLNSLEMLMGLKVTYRITKNQKYDMAYRMLIEEYQYDDHQIKSKILFPKEWRNPWDDVHAAKSLYMLMQYETDRSLMIKYRMNLNRHWVDWKDRDFSFENDALFVFTYQVLNDETIFTPQIIKGIKEMTGNDRRLTEFKKPSKNGIQNIKSYEDPSSSGFVRNYWMGRYYGYIDANW